MGPIWGWRVINLWVEDASGSELFPGWTIPDFALPYGVKGDLSCQHRR